eukprot:TRINITY_DN7623_c0_g1_i6.p1 TRINITY_DN7623_c0_g1~~TRINITY_DN7623_c0_g1_i6.p1  ORF type:complete len:349 (-),score=78.32 TRINITY_DN7623_c0_g1_i6:133-1179(-)
MFYIFFFLRIRRPPRSTLSSSSAASDVYKRQQLSDPRTAKEFAPLWDAKTNNWTVLDNVKVWYNENGTELGINGSNIPSSPGDASFGSLTVGFGCQGNPNLIGPEYGFGFGMNSALKGEPIMIIKTAWGGKTLAGDFRPPSSVGPDPFCTGTCLNEVGHFYQVMVRDVKQLLAHGVLAKMFPALLGLQPKLSGFGWFQGWNDGCDLNQTAAYENNMVNLIKDLRNEWQSPALPVAIAVAGFDGFDGGAATRTPRSDTPWIDMTPADKLHTECTNDRGCRRLDVILSQFAAANKTRHPEIGPVVAIETRGFWRDAQYSPNRAQGYHYWHNAETYYLVGQAMATGMASLL